MVFNFRSILRILFLIIFLFLIPLSLSASDEYVFIFIDLGMEGGFGGSDWYTDYYNWLLGYVGLEAYLGANLFVVAGCSLVFHGFFWNNFGPIPEVGLEFAFINEYDIKHLLTAKARACFVGFDVLQLDEYQGDFDYGDNVWHQGMVSDLYFLGGYRMKWDTGADMIFIPYANVVAQIQDISDLQRVEITEGEYEPGITHTQNMFRIGFSGGIELRSPMFRIMLEAGYVNHMFNLVVKAGIALPLFDLF